MKKCPFCAEEIQDAAIVCKHCHADLAKNAPATVVGVANETPQWKPGVAAVLSLVIPGAGQIYKGQVIGGLVWFVVVIVGYVMLIVPGLALHFFCIIAASQGDPRAESAKQRERDQRAQRADDIGARVGRSAAELLAGKKIDHAMRGGLKAFLVVVALLFVAAGIVNYVDRLNKPAGSVQPSTSSVSPTAAPPPLSPANDPAKVKELNAFVERAQKVGLVKRIDVLAHSVQVNPGAWNYIDADAKKNFAISFAAYCDINGTSHGRFVDIVDAQSGKRVAKLGAFGFSVD